MEILHGNKVGLAIRQPLRTHQGLALRAVAISATVEGDAQVTAGIALLDMPAERGGTATLDRAHDATLPTAKRCSVLLAVEGPGLAKDIRHLEPGGTHVPSQKCAGGVGIVGGGWIWGNRSKGLVVAHTVLVATFR